MKQVVALMLCLGLARGSRDTAKAIKALPAISNSLVNFGKVDVSIHFNTKMPDMNLNDLKQDNLIRSISSPKLETVAEDPCLCTNFKSAKSSFLSNPSELITKILTSNDIFNKESVSSVSCCDSHEHIQEDTFVFEIENPKASHVSPGETKMSSNTNSKNNAMSMIPFILDTFMPNKPNLPGMSIKPKAMEIFFFPKKGKEISAGFDFKAIFPKKKDLFKKPDIQIVGDKELRNEFKNYKFRPSLPISSPILKKNDFEIKRNEPLIVVDKQKIAETMTAGTDSTTEATNTVTTETLPPTTEKNSV